MPSTNATSAVVNASASAGRQRAREPRGSAQRSLLQHLDQHSVDDAPRLAPPASPRRVEPVLLDAHQDDLEGQPWMHGERRERRRARRTARDTSRAPASDDDLVRLRRDRSGRSCAPPPPGARPAPGGARGAPSASGGGSRSCRSGTRPARRGGRGRRRSPRGSPRARLPAARRAPSATRAASSRAACRWSPLRPFSRVRPGDRLPSLQTW